MNIFNEIVVSKKYIISNTDKINRHKFICENIDILLQEFDDNSLLIDFILNGKILCSYPFSIRKQKICYSNYISVGKHFTEFVAIMNENNLKKFCNMLLKLETFK